MDGGGRKLRSVRRQSRGGNAWSQGAGGLPIGRSRRRRFFSAMIAELEAVPRGTGTAGAVTFLGLTLVYAIAVGGHWSTVVDAATANSGFAITAVKMSGQAETSDSALLAALGIDPGVSLVAFDAAEARDRVMALPWIDTASVQKLYPGTLSVTVTERTPFALWLNHGRYFLIDSTGRVIAEDVDPAEHPLPLVAGDGAPPKAREALAMVDSEPGIGKQVRGLVRIGDRRWDVVLKDGVVIRLPEKDPETALASVVQLDAENGLLKRDIAVVDLRLPDRMVVRLTKTGADARREALAKKTSKSKGADT